ncbi:MAG TPA: hypothetical protein VHR41_14920 [Gemmatimonadales bacterium]|jgi:hypothetical protein|nr:hypothetical protein [Gemmatimonadales bacterium]
MLRKLLPAMVLALLTLSGCGKDSGTLTDPGGGGGIIGGGGTGGGGGDQTGGDPVSSDPVTNGGWPNPDGTTPTPQPVDTTVFTPSDSGTAGSGGLSTPLLFQTSGVARYNLGTCGANGTWTDPQGHKYGPHNPNCLLYYSDGRLGNNNKGKCVSSSQGYAGLWLNPGGHATQPYSSKCLATGTSTLSLALAFPAQAELYTANDGSGARILNFSSSDTVLAQLVYHGPADGTTTGAGVLVGTDTLVPPRTWSIGFGQPALNYSTGVPNGDVIAELQDTGVEVVACSSAVGCSLVTLKLSTP